MGQSPMAPWGSPIAKSLLNCHVCSMIETAPPGGFVVHGAREASWGPAGHISPLGGGLGFRVPGLEFPINRSSSCVMLHVQVYWELVSERSSMSRK